MFIIIDKLFLDMYLILVYILFIFYFSNVELYFEIFLNVKILKKIII